MKREERVSVQAYLSLDPTAFVLGGVSILRTEAAPLSPMLNRIVGLGVDEPATEAVLDAALAAIGDDVSCYVAVTPGARPEALVDWLALDGDDPAAAAGIFMADGAGYLGFAATLPGHRGKGAQSALLAARISHAREHGCDVVVTETGERRDDRPSNSYRNILRAGFEEVSVTANWLRPAATP